jgi:signal transduction histidine kinase
MTVSTDLAALLQQVPPIASTTPIDEAADLFLSKGYERLLSLPVVDQGRAVGTLSRFQLNQIFMRRYGRELYGRRPVAHVMNTSPLRVEGALTLEAAAQLVATQVSAPMREDFIIVDQGRYLGVGIVLDLLRAMERRVAQHTAQLVQSEKMASLGQMVAGVAHEINTPLGYVRNNVEMMEGVFGQLVEVIGHFEDLTALFESGGDEAAITAQMVKASAAATELREAKVVEDSLALFKDTLFGVDQIREIVVSLKDFSRLDQARVAAVNLNDCIDQTLVIARNVLKGRVEVTKHYAELPPVSCSPSQVNQVFLNLLTNAAQAIDHDDGAIEIRTESEGGFVSVSILDNGKGIAPENLQKIFDPFFTTKPVGQGTGLGLSISFQIVQAHGGSIRVASEVGRGTRFVVSLPVAAANAIAA